MYKTLYEIIFLLSNIFVTCIHANVAYLKNMNIYLFICLCMCIYVFMYVYKTGYSFNLLLLIKNHLGTW